MTIANRLSIYLPCFLLLFSIPASAGGPFVRKKPGRTTYSKTASGVTNTVTNTDTEIEDLSIEYAMMAALMGYSDSKGSSRKECTCRFVRKRPPCNCSQIPDEGSPGGGGTGDDIVTAYSHTNSRGQAYRGEGPSGPDVSRGENLRGSVTVNFINVKAAPVGWDVGPVAIEYAMMASLMGYSDSEAIEYGIVMALIHAGRADAYGAKPNGSVILSDR